jgi:aspartyl-tRNA(Asn)/glutamyl-tRNA(Gln) amidotransferase subunit A
MYLEDIFTIPANLAGISGIIVPAGQSKKEKLPIGVQILGPAFKEETILSIAHSMYQSIQKT